MQRWFLMTSEIGCVVDALADEIYVSARNFVMAGYDHSLIS